MFTQCRPASVVQVTPTLVDSTNTVTPSCSVAVALGGITEWGWVTEISVVWSLQLWVVIVVVVVGDVVPRNHCCSCLVLFLSVSSFGTRWPSVFHHQLSLPDVAEFAVFLCFSH